MLKIFSLWFRPCGSWQNCRCLPDSSRPGWSRTEPCRALQVGTAGGAPPEESGWQRQTRRHCRRSPGTCFPLSVSWWCWDWRGAAFLPMNQLAGFDSELWQKAETDTNPHVLAGFTSTTVLWLYSCLVLLLHPKTTDFSEPLMDFCSTQRDVYCSCRCWCHQTLIESGHLSVNTAAVTAKRKFIICWHYWILKLNLLTELKMEMTSGFHSGWWWRGIDRHCKGQNKSIIRELTDFCTSAHNLDTQLCWCLRSHSNLFGIVNQRAGLLM